MKGLVVNTSAAVALLLLGADVAGAQTVIALPDTGQTTTLTANVSEQAQVTVPSSVTFNVTDINTATDAAQTSITVENIVLATATKQLRISLLANAASFTPPLTGATTWSATDVSWSTPAAGPNAWLNATRANGTLSSATYTTAATCDADMASCSTTGFTFQLAAKSSVKRSGNHTLVVTWKFESIGA